MNDNDFGEWDTEPVLGRAGLIEDQLILAIRLYLTLDSDPEKILQRCNDLADRYYQTMMDIAEENYVVEYMGLKKGESQNGNT